MLTEAGWDCELLAAEPQRPNLVARLRGETDGPTLALISHVDVVPAVAEEWTHGPFSGDLEGDYVWGRGALDMKDQVASEVAACLELGRSGWRPAGGELLLVVTADEETGAHIGAQWVCAEHPDKVRADMVVNEGAGLAVDFEGRRLYTARRRREGRLPLQGAGAGNGGPRIAAAGRRQRTAEAGADPRKAPRAARARNHRRHRALPRTACSARSRLISKARSSGSATATRELADLLAEPQLGVTLRADDGRHDRQAERDPLARRGLRRLPRSARDDRARGPRADRPGPRRRRPTRSSSSSTSSATAPTTAARSPTRSRHGSPTSIPAPRSCRA